MKKTLMMPLALLFLNACVQAPSSRPANIRPVKKTNITATAPLIKVLFYLQDGVEVLDFAGPLEVFTDAGFDVKIVSKTKATIISQHVLKITPDYSIKDAPAANIVAFFGGVTKPTTDDPEVIDWIKKITKPQYYFSVCTGAFILGKAGILDGQTTTTFDGAIINLRKEVPKATVLANVRYVDNGNVITTAGISAGIDGALHMVSRILGEAKAIEVAKIMEYDKWVPNQGLIVKKSKP